MRQLTTIQNYIFLTGAILMVIGAGCMVLGVMRNATSIIFATGTILFALMQMTQFYSGPSLTIRRLRGLMVIGDLCFIIAGLLAVENVYRILFPYIATTIDGYNHYIQYINNNWVVALLIGAIFEMYTTHRISYELKKETKQVEENEYGENREK